MRDEDKKINWRMDGGGGREGKVEIRDNVMTDALTGRNGVRVSNDNGSAAGFD